MDDPLASEGYFFFGYDAEKDHGIFLGMHPMPYDFSLLRELTGFLLPDGEVLLAKSYGRGRTERRQAGALLSFECVRPFEHWRLEFRGPMQRVRRVDMFDGPLRDGERRPVHFVSDVYGITPVWEAGSADPSQRRQVERSGGQHSHYNQLFRFEATLTYDEDDPVHFAGTGIRDHSRGPRNFAGVRNHQFTFGLMPSGRAFGLFCTRSLNDSAEMTMGYIVEDGKIHHATDVEVTPLARLVENGEAVRVCLTTDLGEASIEGVTLNTTGWTMVPPNDFVFGVDWDRPDGKILAESNVRWTWDGEQGYGQYERSCTSAEMVR